MQLTYANILQGKVYCISISETNIKDITLLISSTISYLYILHSTYIAIIKRYSSNSNIVNLIITSINFNTLIAPFPLVLQQTNIIKVNAFKTLNIINNSDIISENDIINKSKKEKKLLKLKINKISKPYKEYITTITINNKKYSFEAIFKLLYFEENL